MVTIASMRTSEDAAAFGRLNEEWISSLFTLEAHINYLHEIKEGAAVRVEASVLAFDAKRVHQLA